MSHTLIAALLGVIATAVAAIRAYLFGRRRGRRERPINVTVYPDPPPPDTTTEELDDEILKESANAIDDAIADSPEPVRPDVVSDLVAAADAERE